MVVWRPFFAAARNHHPLSFPQKFIDFSWQHPLKNCTSLVFGLVFCLAFLNPQYHSSPIFLPFSKSCGNKSIEMFAFLSVCLPERRTDTKRYKLQAVNVDQINTVFVSSFKGPETDRTIFLEIYLYNLGMLDLFISSIVCTKSQYLA